MSKSSRKVWAKSRGALPHLEPLVCNRRRQILDGHLTFAVGFPGPNYAVALFRLSLVLDSLAAILENICKAVSSSSAISVAMMSGGGSDSVSVKLWSLIQNR